jgi:hypothetical protein
VQYEDFQIDGNVAHLGDEGALLTLAFPALSHPAIQQPLSMSGLRTMLSLVSEPLPLEIQEEDSNISAAGIHELSAVFRCRLAAVTAAIEGLPAGFDTSRYSAAAAATAEWLERASSEGGDAALSYRLHATQIGKEFIDGRCGRFGGPAQAARERLGDALASTNREFS